MGLFSAQISAKEMVPLCRQLSTTYEAGIPIVRSIELVTNNAKERRAKEVLTSIGERLRQGSTLGDAAREQQKYLPPFFVELLASGEHSGKLDVMLRDLAQYYEDRVEMNRAISRATFYPVVLLSACWFLGSFALMIVSKMDFTSTKPFDLPAFFGMYLRFQLQALIVFAVGFAILVALSRSGIPQWCWGWFTTHMWPIKNVARKFALARFFRTMSLLITGGVHIKRCIESSAEATGNPYVRQDLLLALPFVAQGATLTQAFGASRMLTPVAREMIFIGEQSGNLDGTLRKVSEYHFAEAQQAVKVAIKVLQTAMMLLAGATVGYIVITFYSKLYSGILDIN